MGTWKLVNCLIYGGLEQEKHSEVVEKKSYCHNSVGV